MAESNSGDPEVSDIANPPPLKLASIAPEHLLVFNAYPVLRPSYLLLTESHRHQQSSPLTLPDFQAARLTLDQLEHMSGGKRHMMIYNCGRDGGCSRMHKHMQFFEYPEQFTLFPDAPANAIINVPFQYEVVRHDATPVANIALSIYESYSSCVKRFGGTTDLESKQVPHNVVMAREWTLMIPRRRASTSGASANAMGMMGLVWVGSEDELKKWTTRGPSQILSELGVPS